MSRKRKAAAVVEVDAYSPQPLIDATQQWLAGRIPDFDDLGPVQRFVETAMQAAQGMHDAVLADDACEHYRELLRHGGLIVGRAETAYRVWRERLESLYVEAAAELKQQGMLVHEPTLNSLREAAVQAMRAAADYPRGSEDVQAWERFNKCRNDVALRVLPILVAPRKAKINQRDKYIYDQMQAGKSLSDIKDKVNSRNKWEPIWTEQGISQAGKRHAENHGLQWPLR